MTDKEERIDIVLNREYFGKNYLYVVSAKEADGDIRVTYRVDNSSLYGALIIKKEFLGKADERVKNLEKMIQSSADK